MRIFERRLKRLEESRLNSVPVEPRPVFITQHLFGTTEAQAEEKAFRALHKGFTVIVCRTVDGRKQVTA